MVLMPSTGNTIAERIASASTIVTKHAESISHVRDFLDIPAGNAGQTGPTKGLVVAKCLNRLETAQNGLEDVATELVQLGQEYRSASEHHRQERKRVGGDRSALERHLREQHDKAEALEAELKKVAQENAALLKDVAALEDDKAALRERLQEKRGEVDVTKAGQKKAVEEAAALARDKAALEEENAALDDENATLEGEKASLDRDYAALEREYAALEREYAALEKDNATLETRLDEKSSKAHAKTQNDALEELLSEVSGKANAKKRKAARGAFVRRK